MNVIKSLYSTLLRILPRQRIPKLPRGMLSGDYAHLSHDEARIVGRLGARDPRGIKVAMKRHGVNTIDELAQQLKHHEIDRQFRQRLNLLICHISGGHNYDPHASQMKELWRELRQRDDPHVMEMQRRRDAVVKSLEERR